MSVIRSAVTTGQEWLARAPCYRQASLSYAAGIFLNVLARVAYKLRRGLPADSLECPGHVGLIGEAGSPGRSDEGFARREHRPGGLYANFKEVPGGCLSDVLAEQAREPGWRDAGSSGGLGDRCSGRGMIGEVVHGKLERRGKRHHGRA